MTRRMVRLEDKLGDESRVYPGLWSGKQSCLNGHKLSVNDRERAVSMGRHTFLQTSATESWSCYKKI